MKAPKVAAVMTVFNRKDETLRCLDSLSRQAGMHANLTIFVVDDDSSDGTAAAIVEQFPDVRLIRGTGDLFWNGGMRRALEAAYREGFDFYWWLNDDVELDHDALARLMTTSQELARDQATPSIIVGSMRDPDDGRVTYGGVSRPRRSRRFHFVVIEPSDDPVRAETMNGNCVIVPEEVAHQLGNLAPQYRQKMGDFDYGLRAGNAGCGVWVAPGTYGNCATHAPRATDVAPIVHEIRRLWSVKELPFRPWATFTRRWGGPLWALYFVSPYLRNGLRLVAQRLRR